LSGIEDEFDQRAVVRRSLADLLVEVDPLEDILERVRVGVLDGRTSPSFFTNCYWD
jgi:hypothetical protein